MHVEHLIFAVDPKCSGFVNLCKQSCNEIGGPEFRAGIFLEPLPPEAEFIEVLPDVELLMELLPFFPVGRMLFAGRSREISQNGSIVVDTLRQA